MPLHLPSEKWSTVGLLLFVSIALMMAAGCSKETSRKSVVARVDRAELFEEDLAAARDSLHNDPRQSRQYINEWVVNELLYQEAVRLGLAENEQLQRQLEKTKKHLAIEALLEREVYTPDSALISDKAVAAYFASNGNVFVLREDVVNASYVLFPDRDQANAFRSAVLKGTAWDQAVLQLSADSSMRAQILQVASRQYFTQATFYPEELWKLSHTLGKEEVSFAVKTKAGYYVMKVHSVKRQGEIPDLDYVKNEVRDRILIQHRRNKFENLVADLRSKHSVDVHLAETDSVAGE